ncbi:MAG: hypothetical protein COV35_05465 [Alphaproteobacteria bacterium CG11_big_fil_rev_8_21_14_0_20_39_49]|nr:MAG: hypothetical protein COV35_05465 [Alphaproteobacteria bacterium CG11_big_fil_rev_8_21_14_0_20_39_49]
MRTEDFIATLAKEGARKPFPRPSKVMLGWLLAVTAYFGLLIAFYGFRPDMAEKLTQPVYLLEVIGMAITAIMVAWAASWLALPDTNQKSWVRFLPFIPLAFLMGMLVYGMFTNSELTLAECLKLGRYDCIVGIVLYSLLPGGLMFYTIQKAAPARCCWAGTMAGLSVASFGYILLRLIGISDDPTQLLVWHFLPVFMIMAIGMMIGKVYLGRIWQS